MIPIYLHSRQELLERHDRQRRRYQEPPDRRDRRRNWIASIAESGVTDNVGDKMSLTSTTAFTNNPDNKHRLQDSKSTLRCVNQRGSTDNLGLSILYRLKCLVVMRA